MSVQFKKIQFPIFKVNLLLILPSDLCSYNPLSLPRVKPVNFIIQAAVLPEQDKAQFKPLKPLGEQR